MNTDTRRLARQLYDLLPAVYRLRDAELAVPETPYTAALRAIEPEEADLCRRPLFNLVEIIAEQTAVVQESLEQAYDDLFIESCAEWIVPYIGDLIGARPLHGKTTAVRGGRAEVANTLRLRRRKGTLAALEQIARNVTGLPCVAVEFFQRMALTQYMNHIRPENLFTVNLRDEMALERLATPFDTSARTVEVRRIRNGRGLYNIPNIGLFLYRINALALTRANAARIDDFRYTFNPLRIDTVLYNDPKPESDISAFAKPENVPMPISRLALERDKDQFYGTNASLVISILASGDPVEVEKVVVCNLSDKSDGSGDWLHAPLDNYAIDPVLGRLALPSDTARFPLPDPANVTVSFRYGFGDRIGGGEYERGASIEGFSNRALNATSSNVQAALTALAGGGIVEFEDSRTYALAGAVPNVKIAAGATLGIRAKNGARPLLKLEGDFIVEAADNANLAFSGLVICGGALQIRGTPTSVTLLDCTLVPGIERSRQNQPLSSATPVLVVDSDKAAVRIERCVIGQIKAANGATVKIRHSLIDATDMSEVAFSGGLANGESLPGALLDIENSTVIGRIHTRHLSRASNVIFAASSVDGSLPVHSQVSQKGCVRFSAVPSGSRTPRRFHCTTIKPRFISKSFGSSGYGQLAVACERAIREGADDGSEMGVFHDLFQPQRESDLWTRLDEFIRYGMEPGIFYASS